MIYSAAELEELRQNQYVICTRCNRHFAPYDQQATTGRCTAYDDDAPHTVFGVRDLLANGTITIEA